MIISTGIDIVEIKEIKKPILKDKGFAEGVFTSAEIAYCESKLKKFSSYAARFAVKEAVMKAFGTGWASGVSWREIEISNDENGRPFVKLSGDTLVKQKEMGVDNILVSISHSSSFAVASVIFEKID